MKVLDAILARRSVRNYKADPVEEEKLRRVLEAARYAPSAQNRQPWRFIVIRDSKVMKRIRSCYKRDWFLNTEPPVIIVVCAVPGESWVKQSRSSNGLRDYGEERIEDYWKVDVALAMQNLMITATEEGLGTCFIGGFNEHCLRDTLGIPPNMRVVAMTPLGYPKDEPEGTRRPRMRKSLDEITIHDHFPK